MGSVIEQDFGSCLVRRRNVKRFKLGLAVFYLLAIATFIVVGLQTTDTSAEVRAAEVAQAEAYLSIRAINLATPVVRIELVNRTLNAPQYLAGAYHAHDNKTLIIGHSSTIFNQLHQLKIGDYIDYEAGTYRITDLSTQVKEDISMSSILRDEASPTLILMTCAGKPLGGMDFSHRLIITAQRV